jgi:hypothetical protein
MWVRPSGRTEARTHMKDEEGQQDCLFMSWRDIPGKRQFGQARAEVRTHVKDK